MSRLSELRASVARWNSRIERLQNEQRNSQVSGSYEPEIDTELRFAEQMRERAVIALSSAERRKSEREGE